MNIHLIAGRKGGAGRTISAILLGLGLSRLDREVCVLHVRREREDFECDGGLGARFRSLTCPLGVSPWQSALASRTGLHHVPDLRLVRDMVGCTDLVVDWTSDDPADAPGLLEAASSILVPVLPDAIMIDAAARSWLALDDHLMGRHDSPRPRLVMIGATEPRYDPPHRSAMEEVLGGYNADEDHDTTNALLDHALPRLGEACLLDILHEREWWRHDTIADAAMAVATEILGDIGGNPPGGAGHDDAPDAGPQGGPEGSGMASGDDTGSRDTTRSAVDGGHAPVVSSASSAKGSGAGAPPSPTSSRTSASGGSDTDRGDNGDSGDDTGGGNPGKPGPANTGPGAASFVVVHTEPPRADAGRGAARGDDPAESVIPPGSGDNTGAAASDPAIGGTPPPSLGMLQRYLRAGDTMPERAMSLEEVIRLMDEEERLQRRAGGQP